MSPDRFLPARIPNREIVLVEGKVTNKNIDTFLVNMGSNFPYKEWGFSPRLNLGDYSPFFQNLYDTRQEVYIFPDLPRDTFSADHPFNQKGSAERATTIYYDFNINTLRSYEITQGEYAKTSVSTFKYATPSIIPLLEVHTHPSEVLPSPVDYSRLLLADPSYPRRMIGGIVVLTPQCQILALPTSKTPLFKDVNPLLAFMSAWDIKFMDQVKPYIEKRLNRIDKINTAVFNQTKRIMQAINAYTSTLTEETFNELEVEQKFGQAKEELQLLNKKADFLAKKNNIKYGGLTEYWNNAFLLDFASETSMQLYTATDMQHFNKATA